MKQTTRLFVYASAFVLCLGVWACDPDPIGVENGDASSDGGGSDASSDTGSSDTGSSDTGSSDTGGSDTGSSDTGSSDTGGGSDTGSMDTTAPPPIPVDCSTIASAGHELCSSSDSECRAIFRAAEGCAAVCGVAGLVCRESFEDVDGMCAADMTRPALGCADGHQSDYCVCVRDDAPCVPNTCATSPLECGAGHDDGCGGTFDCPATCAGGVACNAGRCGAAEVLCTDASCPAFPGAEGEAMFSRGGRGGSVVHVTTTSNSGSGSFREALEDARDGTTIVFDIGGTIDLTSSVRMSANRITIAGQTAPGDGINIKGFQTELNGNDIIVQHIRFRAGDERKATSSRSGFTEDSLTVTGDRIIIDHVSASWGIDESLSAGTREWTDLTIQNCIISEGLHRTRLFHGEYDADHSGHSMGGLYKPREGNAQMSIHHNLFAHNNNRNPAIGAYNTDQEILADIRNNVVYDCRDNGYVSGDARWVHVNYVGNYMIFGPDSSSRRMFKGNGDANVSVFQSGNRRDQNRNRTFDGTDPGWDGIGDDYDRASSAFDVAPVTTQTADIALEWVLMNAGARPWNRDAVDVRVVNDVRNNTGGRIDSQDEVGGHPTIAGGTRIVDGDRDGMPDDYERMVGTNPAAADNNGDANGDGYTNLENYLHWAGRAR